MPLRFPLRRKAPKLRLKFRTPRGKKAECRGELVYQRLDEKILLKGYNEENALLFVFKTTDHDFELYLPREQARFTSNIFALEFSPEIHSHLKALDLYRALKPLSIPSEGTAVEKAGSETRLKVRGKKGNLSFIAREVTANPQGAVLNEIYYGPDKKPRAVIAREDFREVERSKKEKFLFPYRVIIKSAVDSVDEGAFDKTVMEFESIDFNAPLEDADFAFEPPPGTKTFGLESVTDKPENDLNS
jgi:hypothetical protein